LPIPTKNFRGRNATITMMEFRAQPGEVIDLVSHGMTIRVEKSGKHVATIVPPDYDSESTEITPDGKICGAVPLTYRRNLGG